MRWTVVLRRGAGRRSTLKRSLDGIPAMDGRASGVLLATVRRAASFRMARRMQL
jgi:hypothetical protein